MTVEAMWLVLWINSVKVLVCSCMLHSKPKDQALVLSVQLIYGVLWSPFL